MSTGRDGTIIVVQTQGVTPEDDRRERKNYFVTFFFTGQPKNLTRLILLAPRADVIKLM